MARLVTRRPVPATRAPRGIRGLAVALAMGSVGVLIWPVLLAGTAAPVAAHSELLLSVPAAGAVLPVGPTQISLVFSEPIEARYTALDLLDGTGAPLLAGAGAPSATDPDVLVVDLAAALPAGSYTVDGRASSAADGHDTTGFFVFGVGWLDATGLTHSASSNGSLHPGQDTAHAAAEIQGKTAAYGGAMVAFGLAVLAGLVLLPGLGRVPRGTAYGAAIGLLVAGAGSLILIVVGATSFSATVAEVPADSTWQATVVTSTANGTDIARATFDFAFDEQGLSAGRSTPPIDPLVIVALVLLVGSLLGAGLSLSGRSLPRTLLATSQVAVLAGSVVGGVLGIAILIGGTPR